MAQGCGAAEGPASTDTGALLTGDGVSELGDHFLTDRCLKDRREEGGKREDRREGDRPKGGRQQNKTVVRRYINGSGWGRGVGEGRERQQKRTIKEKHRDVWNIEGMRGHRDR